MKRRTAYLALSGWLAVIAPACFAQVEASSPVASAVAVHANEAPALEPIEVGDTKPAHRFGRFYLAGQPAPDDLARWKALGVRTVINLRMPNETDWDERAAVEALGMQYLAVPFAGPETLSQNKLRKALYALRTGRLGEQSTPGPDEDSEAESVLLHCASSNRVGAVWYAHRILHDGLDREAAFKEAKTVGLRTMGYLEPVDDYIERAKEIGRSSDQSDER